MQQNFIEMSPNGTLEQRYPLQPTPCGLDFLNSLLVPGEPPRELELLDVTPHSAHLRWLAVQVSSQNGHMINYDLHVKNLRTDSFEVYVNFSITRQDLASFDYTFTGLKGLTPYKVQVSLVNEVGIGPAANLTFLTKESGKYFTVYVLRLRF